jgi:hypothetical protein
MYRGKNKLNDLFLGAIGNNTPSDAPIESVLNPEIVSGSDVSSTPTAETQDQVITKEVITTTEGVRSDGKPAYDVVLEKPATTLTKEQTAIVNAPANQLSFSTWDAERKKRIRNTLIVIAVLAIAYYFYTQKNK